MKNWIVEYVFLPFLLMMVSFCYAEEPLRPKRKDAFVGIHLDFHCTPNDQVGANTTDEMVSQFLDTVKTDFIQIDCKGHRGISSYPTKVGNPCPHISGDPLRVWRRVTAKRGISLYLHYSGVWDTEAVAQHPEWGCKNADGSFDADKTSPFGGYVDELMIPQLKELALEYGVDGVWVDGECWAAVPDYGSAATEAFIKETGLDTVPKSKEDANWHTWMDFHRDAFRKRLRHWLDALHGAAPDFEMTSNWAFSNCMPEPVSADVDYISGDFTPDNSVDSVRLTARFIALQGKPWDLMAWSFAHQPGDSHGPWCPKGTAQLMREAACVLSQGGGFQAYYLQKRDGSVDLDRVSQMGEITDFCRVRKPFCFRSDSVPQIALVIPSEAQYERIDRNGGRLFSENLDWQRGLNNVILDNQYSLDVMTDDTFKKDAVDYPAAVLGGWETLPSELIPFMADYVERGGHLYLTGDVSSLFGDVFRCVSWQECGADGSLKVGVLGKGLVVTDSQSYSDYYAKGPTSQLRERAASALQVLLPNPDITVTGSHEVDVSLRRTVDADLSVHLVNTSGDHRTVPLFDDIPSVGPLTVRVKTESKPRSVRLQPSAVELPFDWIDGYAEIRVDEVPIYDILIIR